MSTLPFGGYPDPHSNYTPTPDQFLDVVLRHSCPGVVRLVGFMVRRTYGYSGPQGGPYAPQTEFTAEELRRGADIPVRSFRRVLPAAIAARFGEEIPERPGVYRLRIDPSAEYQTDPARFQGFYRGSEHRTGIPDLFFEYTLRNERVAVCRVILVLLRRRMQHRPADGTRPRPGAVSLQAIAKAAGLTIGATIEALALAVAHGHLEVVDPGNSLPGQPFRPAEYGILAADPAKRGMGQKGYGAPAKRDMASAANGGMAVAAKRGMALSKVVPTGDIPKKQQQTAAAASVENDPEVAALRALGIEAEDAAPLVERDRERVRQELEWLPLLIAEKAAQGDPIRNPAAYVLKRLRAERPCAPPASVIKAREAELARQKEPVRPPIDGAARERAHRAAQERDHALLMAGRKEQKP